MNDNTNNQGARLEAPSPHLKAPDRYLTAGELEELQWMSTVLNHLSKRLSAIELAVSRRYGIASVLRRDNGKCDNSRLAAFAAMSLGIRHEEFPDIDFRPSIEYIDGDIGRKGPLVWAEAIEACHALQNISERISRMCSIEPPQTIFDLRDLSRLTHSNT